MKRTITFKIFAIILIFLSSGCAKNELIPDSGKRNDLNSSPVVSSFGDKLYDILGYGYDITKEYASYKSVGFKVINVERLAAEQVSRVDIGLINTQNWQMVTGVNAEDYLKKISADIKIEASAPLGIFKSTLTSKFNDTQTFNSKYLYGSYNLVIGKKNLKFSGTPAELMNYLDPAFVSDINTNTPQQLVSRYGTHVLSNFVIGGKMEITYRSETYKSDRKFAAEAGLDISIGKVFNVKTTASGTFNENDTKDNYSQTMRYNTIGGDPTIGLFGEIDLQNSTVPKLSFASWQSSVNLDNAQIVDFNQDGLIPIYELIADPVKSAAVKQYILSYLEGNQGLTSYEPVPVYSMLYADGGRSTNHVLTLYPNQEYYLSKNEGIVFTAFAQQKPGTVPLYRYYSAEYNDNFYTIDPSQESLGPYAYEKVGFYVYPDQVANSRPVHRYFSNSLLDHYYTVVKKDYGQYYFERIAFYVPN